MKIHTVEIQKLKAASHGNGLVMFKVDAMVTPKAPIDGIEPSSSSPSARSMHAC
ncbi:hypothetical protein ACVBEH_02105 [Roseateles sp. GG27B]